MSKLSKHEKERVQALVGRATIVAVGILYWVAMLVLIIHVEQAAIAGYPTGQFCFISGCSPAPHWLMFILVAVAGYTLTIIFTVPLIKIRKYCRRFRVTMNWRSGWLLIERKPKR